MGLRLRILSGTLQGKHAPLAAGIIIGRGPGTLSLADSKISGKHATIDLDESGEWVLLDLGSTNGILVDGKRLTRLILKPGVQFTLGQTLLGIEGELIEAKPPPSSEPSTPSIGWSEYFSGFTKKSISKVKDKPKALDPFPKILRLRWLRGLQIDWSWYVGFGPRNFGVGSLDFPIFDQSAKDIAFVIRPSEKGPILECAKEQKILLNKRPISSEVLKAGDILSFGESVLEVSFVDHE